MIHKIYIDAPVDYVMGYIRYGHYEGEVGLTDEEFEKFKENPNEAIHDLNLTDSLDLLIDDYRIEDVGNIIEINWNEVK